MDFILRLGFGAVVGLVVGFVLWRRKVRELPAPWDRRADVAEVVALVAALGFVVFRSYRNVVSPDPWDFPVFYTVARNAVEGLSFYRPGALLATFREVQSVWPVPGDWLQEVGFWYAPPTALWLAPLGNLAYPHALIVNDLVQMGFCWASIFLLHKAFPLRQGGMGVIDMALLVFLFRPVLSAFGLSQIVFGGLLALVIAARTVESRGWLSGVALGIGSVFKHLLIIPALLAVFMRRSRVALSAALTVIVTLLASLAAFGGDVFGEFLENGPGDRSPQLALDAVINSLNGVMRRAFDAVPSGPGALEAILYPPFLVAAALFTAVTLLVVWRASSMPGAVASSFALLTLLALIVYPNTLFNTLPLMLPAVVVLLSDDSYPAYSPRSVVVFVGSVYVAMAGFQAGFAALVAVWAFTTFGLVRALRRRRLVPSGSAPA
ncbi:MAG: DUF2029 domain-containing protein [Actinobacteria bacterium]|nr:DUF2029 domain-containing protein [Actinomycetota bacterium]